MSNDTTLTNSRSTTHFLSAFAANIRSSTSNSEVKHDDRSDSATYPPTLRAWNHLNPPPTIADPPFHSSPTSQAATDALNPTRSSAPPCLKDRIPRGGQESKVYKLPSTHHQDQAYHNFDTIEPCSEQSQGSGADEGTKYNISLHNDAPEPGSYRLPHSQPSRTIGIVTNSGCRSPKSLNSDQHREQEALPGASTAHQKQTMFPGEAATPSFSHDSFQVTPARRNQFGEDNTQTSQISSTMGGFKWTSRTGGTTTKSNEMTWFTQPSLNHQQLQHHTYPENEPHISTVDSSSDWHDDPESAVLSLLSQARARALINDECSTASSSRKLGSPFYRDYNSEGDQYTSASGSQAVVLPVSQSQPRLPSLAPPLSGPNTQYTNGQSTATAGRSMRNHSFSPQVEPPSPLPSPEPVEIRYQSAVGDDDSRTPTAARQLFQNDPELEKYLRDGTAHPYPHPLTGHHHLPTVLSISHRGESSHSDAEAGPLGANAEVKHLGCDTEADYDPNQPSLGLLDEALGFIAAERARREAARTKDVPRAAEDQHMYDDANAAHTKRKRRRKKMARDQDASGLSATRPLLLAADSDVEQDRSTNITSGTLVKPITILARPKPISIPQETRVGEPSLVLTGKKGNRLGRKERERIKAQMDKERAALAQGVERAEDDWDADEDELEDEDEEGEDDDEEFDGDNLDTAAGSRSHIHRETGKGAHKSTPATPGTVTPRRSTFNMKLHSGPGHNGGVDSEDEQGAGVADSSPRTIKSRRKPKKKAKALVHAKSFPNLQQCVHKLDLEDDDVLNQAVPTLDQNKRARLVGLATKLQVLFPEQYKDLNRIVQRLESVGRKSAPAVASVTPGRKKNRHTRNGSKGGSGTTAASVAAAIAEGAGVDESEQDPAELDIINKGPVSGNDHPLIHIFIDHSNILFGLLNFLKRAPPPPGVVADYLASQNIPSTSMADGGASYLASKHSRPINVPTSSSSRAVTFKTPHEATLSTSFESPPQSLDAMGSPIPIPSFASLKKTRGTMTSSNGIEESSGQSSEMSKSLPAGSGGLHAHMAAMRRRNAAKQNKSLQAVLSDGHDEKSKEEESSGVEGGARTAGSGAMKKMQKKFPRHLWHAAFALILERGRAVSRRVVVTSSPLYQPMDKLQNLGYEVRVYIRVPDMGNGMDRERKDAKHLATRPTYGGKGTGSFNKKSHTRHLSGSTSAESGLSAASTNQNQPKGNNQGVSATPPNSAGAASAATQNSRVKYREQGVDELLQLKLHQAIADADVVPQGSTIVLATGDGNVGQFNEDGFLGPVRTALKRGWKVELYAWEDGLSRSWRREFGENSEWGRKGLFRIIPLEQFATSLVEASGW